MNALLLSLLVAASPLEGEGAPLFERPEPHLQRGARLLQQGDADGALEAFRRAAAKTADERAVVEYDVAQALELKARDLAASQQQAQQQAQAPAAAGAPAAEPNAEDAAALKAALNDAKDTYVRAAELARDPRLRSEAHLAAGNTSAVQGELDDAIASYRKSLVADPQNERAKHNLLRVLLAKKQQPPPPEPEPQEGGDENDEKNDEDGDKKNDEPKEGEQDGQKDGDKKDGEQSEGREGQDGDQKDGEQEKEPKDGAGSGDENDPKDDDKDAQKSPADGKDGEKKDGDKKPAAGAAGDQKQSAKDAQRLLEALRAREKPLGPLEMKDLKPARPLHGKDW